MVHAVGNQIRSVYKYELPLTSSPSEIVPLRLPAGSKILKVAEQGSDPLQGPKLWVWALVDPKEALQELRYVITSGTGHEIELTKLSSRDWDYTDTILAMGGHLVVHVWISRAEGKQTVQVSADNE